MLMVPHSHSARAVQVVHLAAQRGLLTLLNPFPAADTAPHRLGAQFPQSHDVEKYDQRRWTTLAGWLPEELSVRDLDSLVRDVSLYKAKYSHV